MIPCQVEICCSMNNEMNSCCTWLDLLWFSLPITRRSWITLMNTPWFRVRVPHGERCKFQCIHSYLCLCLGHGVKIYSFHYSKTIDYDPMGHSTVYLLPIFREKPSASVFNVTASPAFSKVLVTFARKLGVITQFLTT